MGHLHTHTELVSGLNTLTHRRFLHQDCRNYTNIEFISDPHTHVHVVHTVHHCTNLHTTHTLNLVQTHNTHTLSSPRLLKHTHLHKHTLSPPRSPKHTHAHEPICK